MNIQSRNIDRKYIIDESTVSFRHLDSYFMAMHSHEALQVLIPLDNAHLEVSWVDEDQEIDSKTLNVSEISIFPPLLKHEVRWNGSAHFVNFYITADFIRDNINPDFEIDDKIVDMNIGIRDPFIFTLAKSIKSFFVNHDKNNPEYLKATIIVLSQHILDHYHSNSKSAFFNSYEQIPCERIRDAILFIQENLDKKLSITDMADNIGMSEYHFMRTFKKEVGISASQFHLQSRLEKSKELLIKGRTIMDISLDLGFSSQSHFTSLFTKEVGQSPKKFISSQ